MIKTMSLKYSKMECSFKLIHLGLKETFINVYKTYKFTMKTAQFISQLLNLIDHAHFVWNKKASFSILLVQNKDIYISVKIIKRVNAEYVLFY